MGSSEKFCLRWNDFQDNISGAFRELRDQGDFFDVTLACDSGSPGHCAADMTTVSGISCNDGEKVDCTSMHQTIRAHKVILSACSSFFKDLLRSMSQVGGHSQQQPLIYLRGIRFRDLLSILDFMYYGEVNVAQEELNAFLSVAEELRVKGLSPHETVSTGSCATAKRPAYALHAAGTSGPGSTGQAPPCTKRSRRARSSASTTKRSSDDEEPEVVDVKTEMPEVLSVTDAPAPVQSYGSDEGSNHAAADELHASAYDQYSGDMSMDALSGAEDYADGGGGAAGDAGNDGHNKDRFGVPLVEDADLDHDECPPPYVDSPDYRNKIRKLIKFDAMSRQLFCGICHQTGSSFESISNHVEAKHIQRRQYFCQYCNKAFKTKNHRAVHIHRAHREEHKLARVFGAQN